MEVIHLEGIKNKMNNASDCSESNPYILKTHQFYYIQNKNSKYMGKTLRNFILLKVKLLIWFIILKELMNSDDFLSSTENQPLFI